MSKLYQTLENRENIDKIEANGPYLCNRSDAWLGPGYYYWESFIYWAHHWGETCYGLGNYVICETLLDPKAISILNLLDPENLSYFHEGINAIQRLYPSRKLTVPVVIKYLKEHTSFPYVAIKASGLLSPINIDSNRYIKFNPTMGSVLDLRPQVQICLLEKSVIGDNNFKVIFPQEYASGYAI